MVDRMSFTPKYIARKPYRTNIPDNAAVPKINDEPEINIMTLAIMNSNPRRAAIIAVTKENIRKQLKYLGLGGRIASSVTPAWAS